MKRLVISSFIFVGLGMISSFAFYETEDEMDCYVIADADNVEVIYIPDESTGEVCDESCFSVIE